MREYIGGSDPFIGTYSNPAERRVGTVIMAIERTNRVYLVLS